VKKGDVITTARLAAIMAVKDTPRLIPLCHPIPITGLEVNFDIEPGAVRATVIVTSVGKTGVEMEALAGVSAALLNVWDMVKYLEKDETGNYPCTEIEEILVVKKYKEDGESARP
jgi:cyclic pyranopterin phosphate synthase